MITKLTLTVDDKVIHAAKKYARLKGKSLSNLVENYLRSIDSQKPEKHNLDTKITKLMGVIKLPENFNYREELGAAISSKHKK